MLVFEDLDGEFVAGSHAEDLAEMLGDDQSFRRDLDWLQIRIDDAVQVSVGLNADDRYAVASMLETQANRCRPEYLAVFDSVE